jgi:hypothetical protein
MNKELRGSVLFAAAVQILSVSILKIYFKNCPNVAEAEEEM